MIYLLVNDGTDFFSSPLWERHSSPLAEYPRAIADLENADAFDPWRSSDIQPRYGYGVILAVPF